MAVRPKNLLPSHIAIIMDGNGRWAKMRNLDRVAGHLEGAKSVKVVARKARKLGIPYLTLFALSTENLKRPKKELSALFDMLRDYMKKELPRLIENGIRLNVIGRKEWLPEDIQEGLASAMKRSSHCKDMVLTIALCYGGRDEIVRASERLLEKGFKGEITERVFSSYLDTKGIPDPDLLIRTGGEVRISNFLLWQLAYTELYFTKTLWPDFRARHLVRAIEEYKKRERRFGLTTEQLKGKN